MSKDNHIVLIADFKPDNSFFDDLREGNFCLVLGAGFSFGVKNKNKEFSTIPTAEQFIKFTNEKFTKSVTEYKAAASVWENKIANNPNLLNELRNLFLVDETAFNFELFDSVFLPNWYSIFTFNFDNVLTTIQSKHKGKKYPVFNYPAYTMDSNDNCILHLHGLMNEETTLDNIVFTSASYTKLGAEQNSLYNVIYGDIDSNKKKLIILGTQFNEQIVFDKFFKGLKGNDIKIYHFDLKNDDVAEKAEFKDRDYTFIKLYKDECIKGTKLFLQFLQDNKDKIENIHIEGAEVINSTFIRRIKNGKQFTKPDFYTAKQDENCQWYGVINNYDVVRNDYGKVKTIASSCFDKPRTYKVVAVVHGFGGCGKSTLLRRLAVELCNESFKFIWVKDRGFENFTDNGLIQIQEDRFRNYLVIIEDWYRLTDNLKEKAKEFLLKTQAINNIRVIIGDRETSGKEYINNLPDPLNVFHLQSTENEKIIAEIMELHTEWKDAKEKVTKKQEYYNTSLFLLLFVIARVSNEKFDPMEIDFSEPGLAFKSIVKSDLKKINAVYPGMAKALHNWACIYTNHKIFIDFDTFLKIADTYNENDKVSNAFTSWNARSTILERVKSYINKGRNTSLRNKKLQQIDFVQFNHDKLAEEGLAGVILDGWLEFYNPVTKKYDDLLLKQFLNIVIDNYAPSYDNFSSFFLAAMMQYQNQIFADGQEKLLLINILFEKGNLYPSYLNHLTDEDINLTPVQIVGYLDKLYDKKVYPNLAWLNYFKKAGKEEKQQAAHKILSDQNITSLQHDIVVAAFNQKENETEKQLAAQKILSDPNIYSINGIIVNAAFNQKGNETEKQQAAQNILSDPNITSLQTVIVVAAFNQNGNETEKLQAAQKILSDPNITSLQHDIVVAAFNQKENETEKQQAAHKILSDPNITSLIHHIVVAAFNQKGNETEKQQAAHKILSDQNITSLQPEIVVAAFNQKENETEKQKAAQKILSDPDWNSGKYLFSVLSALRYYSSIETTHDFVTIIISNIINNFLSNRKLKLNRDFYYGLMDIPFHQNYLWKTKSEYIFANWRTIERRAITNLLNAYQAYPDTLKPICKTIMNNWQTEIEQKIFQVYGESHKGDHIRISLGHPSLKSLAKKTAEEIVKTKKENSVTIPDYLFEIAEKIVNEAIYPDWKLNNNENE